jgi:phage recombination protein Bet
VSEALVVREDRTVMVTPDQMALIKHTIAPDATDAELQLFLYDNARRGVHPLDKLIFFTKRKGKYTPITSIDFMRMRAAETGEYAGSDDAVFVDIPATVKLPNRPDAAKVTVYRLIQGQRCPFTATARWDEYYPGDGDIGFMWRKMPHTMLAKCAEAMALRKGFPQQIAGLYTAEEMAQANDAPMPAPTRPLPAPKPVPVPAPAPLPQVAPEDEVPFDPTEFLEPAVYVERVLTKDGTSAAGNKWTRYDVFFTDGSNGSTFKDEIGRAAQTHQANHTKVIVTLETNPKYKDKFTITQLLKAE